MYFLAENSRRRENVIAALTAAFVGVAMIAIAEKASATDASVAHDHATITSVAANDPVEADKRAALAASAADIPDSHAHHALAHEGQGESSAHDHRSHSKGADE